MLVMLVGYSLARFKRRQLFAGEVSGVLRSLAFVLAPYALIVAGYSLARGEVLWPSVFLIGNFGFGSWVKFTLVLGAVLVVLYLPRVAVPARIAQFLLPISAASYHIYLFHRIIPEWLLPYPNPAISEPFASSLAVLVGLVSGLVAFALQRWVLGLLPRRQSHRRNYERLVINTLCPSPRV